jgi:hypothetical protein
VNGGAGKQRVRSVVVVEDNDQQCLALLICYPLFSENTKFGSFFIQKLNLQLKLKT